MINGINHITIATNNVANSFNFYHEILGFKPLCKWHKGAYFLAGNLWFCISYDEHASPTMDYTHIAFNVALDDFKAIKDKIIASGAKVFKDNKSEGDSLYITDPDGHKLEIHVGSWQSRIANIKQNPSNYQNIEFFV